MNWWHKIRHRWGWIAVRLLSIEHGYFRHTRTKCDGGCLLPIALGGSAEPCEHKLHLVCTECGDPITIRSDSLRLAGPKS